VGEWTDTEWTANPFMVRLEIMKNGVSYICGGSIIATEQHNGTGVILTAAHCVVGAENVNVWIGCTMTNCGDSLAEKYDAEFIVVHSDYDQTTASSESSWCDNDVAVVFLDRAITVEGATSIGLHHDIGFMDNDAAITVFGYYGSCGSDAGCVGGSDVDSLEYALTNYMASTECDDIYGLHVMGPHDFCVKDDFRGDGGLQSVCMGDSGSPAVIAGKQIGLNSWGPGDCDPQYPTVLTSVPFYIDWIAEQCPQCVGEPDAFMTRRLTAMESAATNEAEDGVIGENMLFDMDRVVMFQDGASGQREAVSVRDLVVLGLEIIAVLMVSAVMMTVLYRRYNDKEMEEAVGADSAKRESTAFEAAEMKPLLKAIEV